MCKRLFEHPISRVIKSLRKRSQKIREIQQNLTFHFSFYLNSTQFHILRIFSQIRHRLNHIVQYSLCLPVILCFPSNPQSISFFDSDSQTNQGRESDTIAIQFCSYWSSIFEKRKQDWNQGQEYRDKNNGEVQAVGVDLQALRQVLPPPSSTNSTCWLLYDSI